MREKSPSILREILIKAQPITIPLKKENERTKKHLLWIHEGLLKDAEWERKKFLTALKRHSVCLLSVGQSWWGMEPGTQRRWFRMVWANGTKQERPRFGGHERGRPSSLCREEGRDDLLQFSSCWATRELRLSPAL